MAINALLIATSNDAALKTLGDIQRYAMPNRFSLSSLARVLERMGHSEVLHAQLSWLVAHEYLKKDVAAVYDVTKKGRAYSSARVHEVDDSPMFDFLSTNHALEPAQTDPRQTRRCQ